MRNILILAVALATLTAGAVAALAEAGAEKAAEAPEEVITVTNYGKKAPVNFDHGLHTAQGTECVACHHTVTPDNADAAQYKCGQCHKGDADGDAPKIKDALHGKDKGACYSCHLAKEAPNKFKCSTCHKS